MIEVVGKQTRIAVVTTTVNVPNVLRRYASVVPESLLGDSIKFFVAGDLKTPHTEVHQLCDRLKAAYLHPEHNQHWKHVPLIGVNTDSLRNVAVLHALRWGADFLISIDDDMILSGYDFFPQIALTLSRSFSGVCLGIGDSSDWFDAGNFTIPPARQRGLPASNWVKSYTHEYVDNVQIGAMQGIILGTPDTDAATTIANRPLIHSATDILKNGFVVDPNAHAVFNSQLTAFRRELAPAFAQFYKWEQRNTDIIASLIMRRIMRDRNLYTYFGPPTGFHARAPRDPLKDLNSEMWGLNKIREFQDYLENTSAIPHNVVGSCVPQLRRLYEDMLTFQMFPKEDVEARLAWLEDCESVL